MTVSWNWLTVSVGWRVGDSYALYIYNVQVNNKRVSLISLNGRPLIIMILMIYWGQWFILACPRKWARIYLGCYLLGFTFIFENRLSLRLTDPIPTVIWQSMRILMMIIWIRTNLNVYNVIMCGCGFRTLTYRKLCSQLWHDKWQAICRSNCGANRGIFEDISITVLFLFDWRCSLTH